MTTPGIADECSDGAPVDQSTTPTGVADFDFELPNQGYEDAWAEVNTIAQGVLPLEDASNARDVKDARHSFAEASAYHLQQDVQGKEQVQA
jgi:hypothetical protein